MPFKFEMSDVKNSLTNLYHYIAEIANEDAWKNEPLITDSAVGISNKVQHPNATPKEVKANTEPFSSIEIFLAKPHVPQFNLEFSYTGKKAVVRFGDMLQDRNQSIRDAFFAIISTLNGFTFKLQVKTTYKKVAAANFDDIFVVPSNAVSVDDVVENLNKAVENCSSTEMTEGDKVVKSRVPRVVIFREFSMDDLELENSPFDTTIKNLHELMLSETKIVSEKEVEKSRRGRSKIEGKNKFKTIISNRADKQFYCRLTKAELERLPENVGVLIWDIDTYEEKKYIRGALKLVSEI